MLSAYARWGSELIGCVHSTKRGQHHAGQTLFMQKVLTLQQETQHANSLQSPAVTSAKYGRFKTDQSRELHCPSCDRHGELSQAHVREEPVDGLGNLQLLKSRREVTAHFSCRRLSRKDGPVSLLAASAMSFSRATVMSCATFFL